MRTCSKCGVAKPLEAFQVTSKVTGYRRRECKECELKRHQRYAAESKRKIKELSPEYAKNREKSIAAATAWNKTHPDRHAANSLAHYYRLQNAAIMAYGGYVCACCGEREPMFLSLDHMGNDGKAHRIALKTLGGARLYRDLRDRGWPAGFQVLCMNCNQGRHRNGGVCPHKEGATTIPKGSSLKRGEAPDAISLIYGDDMVSSASEDAAANKAA